MDILNTKKVLAIGLTSAMSIGTATADIGEDDQHTKSPIISISSPDLRVTVYVAQLPQASRPNPLSRKYRTYRESTM